MNTVHGHFMPRAFPVKISHIAAENAHCKKYKWVWWLGKSGLTKYGYLHASLLSFPKLAKAGETNPLNGQRD